MRSALNVLVLYDETQTYTSTVFDHVDSFRRFLPHHVFYTDYRLFVGDPQVVHSFDAVVVHYSVRIAFGALAGDPAEELGRFDGYKCLYIQDEYDCVNAAVDAIRTIGFTTVFSCVPEDAVATVYRDVDRQRTRFRNVLTGYAPANATDWRDLPSASQRPIAVGYRGRDLPLKYGRLGQDKVWFPMAVRERCDQREIRFDIESSEETRLYGDKWTEFLLSARTSLGTESGSNVFDFDGTLVARIERAQNSGMSNEEIARTVIEPLEMDGVMNQASPRLFEAAANRSGLVLLEGRYSGLLEPGVHYLPVRRDLSNLDSVLDAIQDPAAVDEISEAAYETLIASGQFTFERMVMWLEEDMAIFSDSETRSGSRGAVKSSWSRLGLDRFTPTPRRPQSYSRSVWGRAKAARHLVRLHLTRRMLNIPSSARRPT